ncbi:hypothetical protein K438DRAFT_1758120 [Mycena galopus ATCC 62051]|nr:hypothetical protein K438DRAFT_1758120 [Mycena galopus ATCC 62051]
MVVFRDLNTKVMYLWHDYSSTTGGNLINAAMIGKQETTIVGALGELEKWVVVDKRIAEAPEKMRSRYFPQFGSPSVAEVISKAQDLPGWKEDFRTKMASSVLPKWPFENNRYNGGVLSSKDEDGWTMPRCPMAVENFSTTGGNLVDGEMVSKAGSGFRTKTAIGCASGELERSVGVDKIVTTKTGTA